jgi:hypothetical protein
MNAESSQALAAKIKLILAIEPSPEQLERINQQVLGIKSLQELKQVLDNGKRPTDKIGYLEQFKLHIDKTIALDAKIQTELDRETCINLTVFLAMGACSRGLPAHEGDYSALMDGYNGLMMRLSDLSNALGSCISTIQKKKRSGPKGDRFTHLLIKTLMDIFQEMTSTMPARTWNYSEGKEDGPFLRFTEVVIGHFAIKTKGSLSYYLRVELGARKTQAIA